MTDKIRVEVHRPLLSKHLVAGLVTPLTHTPAEHWTRGRSP